jgi:molecular chaperone DnaK (HSP70)
VKVIQEWPGRNAEDVPSQIRYTSTDASEYKWGYEASFKGRRDPTAQEIISWFKLLLQNKEWVVSPGDAINTNFPQDDRTSPAKKSAEIIKSLGITPEKVVTDYLKALRECLLDVFVKTYGKESGQNPKVKYVLTIPAIWNDSAKSQMVNAAQAAGFGRHRVDFSLIGEPESAAAYTLHVMQPSNLKVSAYVGARLHIRFDTN